MQEGGAHQPPPFGAETDRAKARADELVLAWPLVCDSHSQVDHRCREVTVVCSLWPPKHVYLGAVSLGLFEHRAFVDVIK